MALSFEAFESPRKQPEVPRKNVSVPIHNGPTVPSFTTSNISSLLDERQPDFTPTLRFYLAFATLAVITLMVALDGTSLSVALPIIAQKLQGTAIEAFWSGTSFLLCSTVFQPSYASFSHIFGRRPMILVALTIFLAGAIAAAVASDFAILLVGRSLQGVGGGGLIALTEIVVTDLSLGSVTGPIVGGAFAEKVSWRWIFWINLPFIGVAFVVVPIFLRLQFKPSHFADKLRRVDWIGSVLFVASATSFLIPITWGGVSYPWHSWRTLVPLILGVFGLTGFVLFEGYVAAEPLIPLSIFKNRTAAVSYIGTVIHGMILWSMLYYLPLYYEAVKGQTPILAGVSLFPETFTVAPAAMITGIIVSKTGRYRWATWSGWGLTTVGTGVLYLLDVNTSTVGWVFLNLISGVGMGMLFTSMAQAIQASVANRDLAFAVAMFCFFRAFGQAIGVAVGGTVFQNQIKSKLLQFPTLAPMADAYSRDALSLVQIIKAMPMGADKMDLKQSYADALKIVWLTMCGLSALAMVLSLWTRGLDLDRPLLTEQGFKERHGGEDAEK